MEYTKPPRSLDDQITLLSERGLVIADYALARHYLDTINYYRLRGYWIPFEQQNADGGHGFRPGTTFEDVLSLYVFDRRLRMLLLDLIEKVEVMIRARWAHSLAMAHGAHAYLDPKLFKREDWHLECLRVLEEDLLDSKEPFVAHYRETYTNPRLPPIWLASEVLTIGQLSKWVSNVGPRTALETMFSGLTFDPIVLVSFLHHLSHVRNLCAHHYRIWNRHFTVTMMIPKYPRRLAELFNPNAPRQIYNTLVMLWHLMMHVDAESRWRQSLKQLFVDHPKANPGSMGFPERWLKQNPWIDA